MITSGHRFDIVVNFVLGESTWLARGKTLNCKCLMQAFKELARLLLQIYLKVVLLGGYHVKGYNFLFKKLINMISSARVFKID